MSKMDRVMVWAAIIAYLSAVQLPCEVIRGRDGSVQLAVPIHALAVDLKSKSTSTLEPDSALASQPGHAGHHAHNGTRDQEAHASHHEMKAVRPGVLEWVPTCLCGCSDTRSQVGGGTARLGSVVPGAYVAKLLPAVKASKPPASLTLVSTLTLMIDLIPI